MAEYTEYSKRRNLQNIVYFIKTEKEAEAKNARLFWNVENSIFALPFTIDLMTVRGGEGEGEKHEKHPLPFSLSPTPFDVCYAGYYDGFESHLDRWRVL